MQYARALYALLSASVISSAVAIRQRPIVAQPEVGPVMPQQPAESTPSSSTGDSVILSDVLGRDRSINIFAGFTRDIESVDKRINDAKSNTTILAPINSAIMALPRKPWENPKEYETLGANAYEGSDGEARAHGNLRHFVEAHIVVDSPWQEGQKVKTLNGDEVWWEAKDGVKVVFICVLPCKA